jgi:hypothetical protein
MTRRHAAPTRRLADVNAAVGEPLQHARVLPGGRRGSPRRCSALSLWTAMKEGLLGDRLGVSSRSEHEEARSYVARWAGSESAPAGRLFGRYAGEVVEHTAAPPDGDGLRQLAERLRGERVRAVIESMTGARFVHDTLEVLGWEVLVADAQKVKGLAPLACKTDKIDARVLAELSWRDLVPAIWLPDPSIRATGCIWSVIARR